MINHQRITLDQCYLRLRASRCDRQTGSACACAKIGKPPCKVARNSRRKDHRIDAGTMARTFRLHQHKLAAMENVDGFRNHAQAFSS